MNLGKCATCGYVNESATAMCARADCALSADPAAANEALKCGAKLGGLTCELTRGHSDPTYGDMHQMGKCRWNDPLSDDMLARGYR